MAAISLNLIGNRVLPQRYSWIKVLVCLLLKPLSDRFQRSQATRHAPPGRELGPTVLGKYLMLDS